MQSRLDKTLALTEEAKYLIINNNGPLIDPSKLKEVDRRLICSVGDYTTEILHKNGIMPFLEVCDLKTQRNEKGYKSVAGSKKIKNSPGTISKELSVEIRNLLEGGIGGRIEVEGEEDLAVIPIIFYGPIHTHITYGIPNSGMACIVVNQDVKKLAIEIISKMEVIG
ncbi:GTP-dependent dephospho-CoA kinase family protein [Caldiplasma sukawensis]